jgi:hypothetical protein
VGPLPNEPDYAEVLVSTVMTISQAIKAGEDLGMYQDGGVDSSEFWALYLWVLGPYANTTNLLDPNVIDALVYSNASSESIEDAQNTVFSKSDENLEIFKIVSKELQSALEDKFLNLDSMDNEVFTQDCINLMTENYKIKFYATYTNETSVLIYILTLALRSIIMDTLKVNIAEKNHRRRFGFFLASVMLSSWNYKSKLS